jgi:beta-lactam-binding protein with PASTA domain
VTTRRLTIVAAIAVALAGCSGGADGGDKRVIAVPNVVGMTNPEAETTLVQRRLRWLYLGSDRVQANPTQPPNTILDPFNGDVVIDQEPDAGTRVKLRAVVVLDTRCAKIGREGEGACL